MKSSGRTVPPGIDGKGGSCIAGAISSRVDYLVPTNLNTFLGSVGANGTYDRVAWQRCCKYKELNLALMCYPWCEIPDETIENAGGGVDRVGNAMHLCLGDDAPTISRVKLGSGNILRLGLGQLAVFGLAMAAMVV